MKRDDMIFVGLAALGVWVWWLQRRSAAGLSIIPVFGPGGLGGSSSATATASGGGTFGGGCGCGCTLGPFGPVDPGASGFGDYGQGVTQ